VDFIKDRKIQLSHYVQAIYPLMIMIKLLKEEYYDNSILIKKG